MPLTIVPGPLPEDGARVNFEQMLTAFVRGTTITGFGHENFAGGSAAVVYSATEAPATSARFPGLLWYQRGTGALHSWTIIPQPSALFSPSVSTTATHGLWLRISDGRDMLVRQRFTAAVGDALFVNTAISEWKAIPSNESPPRYTLVMAATAHTGGSLGGGEQFVFCHNPHLCPDPRLICTTAVTGGQYHAARAFGYVNAWCVGLAAEATDPIHYTQRPGDVFHQGVGRGCTSWSENLISLGFVVDSGSSGLRALRKIFKNATISNLPHLGGLSANP